MNKPLQAYDRALVDPPFRGSRVRFPNGCRLEVASPLGNFVLDMSDDDSLIHNFPATRSGPPGLFIVNNPLRSQQSNHLVRYDPMLEIALHRQFMDGTKSETEILAFATRYGYLTAGELVVLPHAEPSFLELIRTTRRTIDFMMHPGVCIGERLSTWHEAHAALAELVALWDATRTLTPSTVSALHPQARQWLQEAVEGHDEVGEELVALLRRSLSIFVMNAVNDELGRCVSPRISPGGGKIDLEPRDLWAALWAHFALEIADVTKPYRPCAHCKEFFVVDDAREIYCSKKCKTRAYRARLKKEEGKEL